MGKVAPIHSIEPSATVLPRREHVYRAEQHRGPLPAAGHRRPPQVRPLPSDQRLGSSGTAPVRRVSAHHGPSIV